MYDLSFGSKVKDCGIVDDVDSTPIVSFDPSAAANFWINRNAGLIGLGDLVVSAEEIGGPALAVDIEPSVYGQRDDVMVDAYDAHMSDCHALLLKKRDMFILRYLQNGNSLIGNNLYTRSSTTLDERLCNCMQNVKNLIRPRVGPRIKNNRCGGCAMYCGKEVRPQFIFSTHPFNEIPTGTLVLLRSYRYLRTPVMCELTKRTNCR